MIVQKKQLQEAINLLQDRLKPEAIYLFGSQASGRATLEKGDVDLCVIVADDKDPYRETVDAYESLKTMPFPKDIIVRRKIRFEKRSAWPSTLEHEVRQTGRMLFPLHELVQEWLAKAEEDWAAAHVLLAEDSPLVTPSLFHMLQCAEKLLKA